MDASNASTTENYQFKLLIPGDAVGSLVGTEGSIITVLEKESGCRISLSPRSDYYPGTRDRVCHLLGTIDSVLCIIDFILKSLEKLASNSDSSWSALRRQKLFNRSKLLKCFIPQRCAFKIIGNGGEIVKSVMSRTGTSIEISREHPNIQERCLTISGEKGNIRDACKMILELAGHDIAEGFYSNVHYANKTCPLPSAYPRGAALAPTALNACTATYSTGEPSSSFIASLNVDRIFDKIKIYDTKHYPLKNVHQAMDILNKIESQNAADICFAMLLEHHFPNFVLRNLRNSQDPSISRQAPVDTAIVAKDKRDGINKREMCSRTSNVIVANERRAGNYYSMQMPHSPESANLECFPTQIDPVLHLPHMTDGNSQAKISNSCALVCSNSVESAKWENNFNRGSSAIWKSVFFQPDDITARYDAAMNESIPEAKASIAKVPDGAEPTTYVDGNISIRKPLLFPHTNSNIHRNMFSNPIVHQWEDNLVTDRLTKSLMSLSIDGSSFPKPNVCDKDGNLIFDSSAESFLTPASNQSSVFPNTGELAPYFSVAPHTPNNSVATSSVQFATNPFPSIFSGRESSVSKASNGSVSESRLDLGTNLNVTYSNRNNISAESVRDRNVLIASSSFDSLHWPSTVNSRSSTRFFALNDPDTADDSSADSSMQILTSMEPKSSYQNYRNLP